MKRIISFLTIAAIAAMTVIGCKKPEPEPEKAELSVATATGSDASSLSAAAAGEVLILTVKANVPWTANSPDWVIVSPSTGTGNGAVKVTVAENTGEARTGDITFSYDGGSAKVTINQAGAGTTPEPEGITTAAEFITFLKEAATKEESEVITISADLDLAGQTIPTGVEFVGTLDGQGHTIKNMKSSKGLFDVLNGTVKDLKIDSSCEINYTAEIPDMMGLAFIAAKSDGKVINCEVAGKIIVNTATAGRIYCAGLVGEQQLGYIEGCKFTGSIDVTLSGTSKSCSAIAGVVARPGKSGDTAGKVIVKDCVNEGNIKFLFSGATKAMKKFGIGGIVGQTPSFEQTEEAVVLKDCGTIEGCTNKGNIEWSYPEGGNGSYPCMGGVAGIVEGRINGCNNYGKLKYTGSKTVACTDAAFGGVAGYVTLDASDCHNYGTFEIDAAIAGGTALAQSGGNTEYSSFGGVFGCTGPFITASNKTLTTAVGVVVENCTNEAEIIFTPSMVNSGGPQMCFGGVSGANTAIMRNCHNNKPVTVKSNTRTINAGAITGWTSADIEDCTNKGAFVVDGDLENHQSSITYQQCYVGGIVGKCLGLTIKNCKNTAPVTLQNVFTSPDNMSYLGGINANYDGTMVMENCENSGAVTNSANTAFRVGGISGQYNGQMSGTKNSGAVSSTAAYTTDLEKYPTKTGELGGIAGYSSAASSYKNCEQTGNLKNAAVAGYTGGIAAAIGNTSSTETLIWAEGTTVNCSVDAPATKASILAWCNTATSDTVSPFKLQIGTAEAPVKVQGAIAALDPVANANGNDINVANVQK